MKKLLLMFLILLPIIVHAQYANNIVVDGAFTSAGNWTAIAPWVVSGGVASIDGSQTATKLLSQVNTGVTVNTTFKVYITMSNYIAGNLMIRHSSSVYDNFTEVNGVIKTGFTTTATVYEYVILAADLDLNCTLDDFFYLKRVDTLWVSPGGNDTDADTVQTLGQAFTVRGAHSGGVFKILPGTYAEYITIDSSFTKMYTTGDVAITSINFNSKTLTVDGCFDIGTKLNDSNVTYTNPCATGDEKKYPKYDDTGKFKRW